MSWWRGNCKGIPWSANQYRDLLLPGIWVRNSTRKETFKRTQSPSVRATDMMQKFTTLARKYKILLSCVRLYYNVVLAGIVGHVSSAWTRQIVKNTKIREKVDRAQRRFLIRMTGEFRTIFLDTLEVATGVLPLHLQIRKRVVMYWINLIWKHSTLILV